MMPSSRYLALQNHIEDLRQHLLPTPFVESGAYTAPGVVQTQTAAFIVMVHAELEAYFEDRAVEIAVAARETFVNSARGCRATTCLLGFVEGASKKPGEKIRPDQRRDVDIKSRVEDACARYVNFVRMKNHGIKEDDLTAVLLPIGVPYYEFDTLVVGRLNTLGTRRGQFVHASRTSYITQHLDPKTQYEDMKKLVHDIAKLDTLLDVLLSEATTSQANGSLETVQGS